MLEAERKENEYDAIVIGCGHAGIEAGLALAKTGCKTLMLSISLDNIGYLACNPSIGGTAKGHLVREVDALGGQMGIAADKTLTQLRMLNDSKGPAVHSLRAQVDKYAYHFYMKRLLENQPGLDLRQGEAVALLCSEDGRQIQGVQTTYLSYRARVVVIATGVYQCATVMVGDRLEPRGPASFARSEHLSADMQRKGIRMRRFKTGTPARVHKDSIDLTALERQAGQETMYSFSALSKKIRYNETVCYLGYTNRATHAIISANAHRTARSKGLAEGVGARYCPSIEDKVVRFADKERHSFFLEPEGKYTKEMYVQGLSTSLPADAQLSLYRSIAGFERVHIMRDAYAIEYDCIDPQQLYPTLMHKTIDGLFFAGQINGTSGYEEAAAQGIVAGMNASLYIRNQPLLVLERENSYIGVLIDDLVTKGTNEPYRMMTSRAEYRLHLRQDNADLRLTELGYKAGLADSKRYRLCQNKKKDLERARGLLDKILPPQAVRKLFEAAEEPLPSTGISVEQVIKRGNITPQLFVSHLDCFENIGQEAIQQLFIEKHYEGYIARQERARREQLREGSLPLPPRLDYHTVKGLRIEAAEKMNLVRPLTIGQAGRISGVTPADINVLIIYLKKCKKE